MIEKRCKKGAGNDLRTEGRELRRKEARLGIMKERRKIQDMAQVCGIYNGTDKQEPDEIFLTRR
jgi:hypothetical protein